MLISHVTNGLTATVKYQKSKHFPDHLSNLAHFTKIKQYKLNFYEHSFLPFFRFKFTETMIHTL